MAKDTKKERVDFTPAPIKSKKDDERFAPAGSVCRVDIICTQAPNWPPLWARVTQTPVWATPSGRSSMLCSSFTVTKATAKRLKTSSGNCATSTGRKELPAL